MPMDLHEVEDMFPTVSCRTSVWLSERARTGLMEFTTTKDKPSGAFLKKLKYYAEAGFRFHEGEGQPVKSEGNGVYRVGKDLFRIVGFYEDDRKVAFVGIATLQKRGMKLSGPDRAIIREVADVKMNGLWK